MRGEMRKIRGYEAAALQTSVERMPPPTAIPPLRQSVQKSRSLLEDRNLEEITEPQPQRRATLTPRPMVVPKERTPEESVSAFGDGWMERSLLQAPPVIMTTDMDRESGMHMSSLRVHEPMKGRELTLCPIVDERRTHAATDVDSIAEAAQCA